MRAISCIERKKIRNRKKRVTKIGIKTFGSLNDTSQSISPSLLRSLSQALIHPCPIELWENCVDKETERERETGRKKERESLRKQEKLALAQFLMYYNPSLTFDRFLDSCLVEGDKGMWGQGDVGEG